MITRYFNVYLNAGVSVAPVINVNQYDRGEQWIFTLLKEDGTVFTPSSGAICGVKSDGHGILNSATVDSSGRVVVTETEQMTAAAGQAIFELSIDGQTHGTANFVVMVERKPTDQAEMSDSDYSFIQELVDTVEADTEIVEQATAAVASIVPSNPGTAGQVLTRASSGAVWADAVAAGSVATVQDATASRNFSAGEYIVRNGVLYKVTTAVSSGATWGSGNTSQTSVGSELKDQNTPQQLTLVPGANVTISNISYACVLGNFIYAEVTGQATAAVSNATLFSMTGTNKKTKGVAIVPIGVSNSEWDLTGVAYGYIGFLDNVNKVMARITSGQWFHIILTVPCE